MENKRNKDAIIVLVLMILLVLVIGAIIWISLTDIDVTDNSKDAQNSNEQLLKIKDDEIALLKQDIVAKDNEISSLKKENEELKGKEGETVVTKNNYVLFDGGKVKLDGSYISGRATLYPVTVLDFDENYAVEINENGGVNVNYKNKTYTVKGFSKKAVELYAMSDSQTAKEGVIAIMSDGTIEQIYFDGNDFKTRGTIAGVKDVVKLIYVKVNGMRYAAAVQANGDTVVLSGLENYYNPGI